MHGAGLVVPRLPRQALQMAVAIVGAGIMPANFYLHSALVHSRCSLRCMPSCYLCGVYHSAGNSDSLPPYVRLLSMSVLVYAQCC